MTNGKATKAAQLLVKCLENEGVECYRAFRIS
jgi:hypothetical protein